MQYKRKITQNLFPFLESIRDGSIMDQFGGIQQPFPQYGEEIAKYMRIIKKLPKSYDEIYDGRQYFDVQVSLDGQGRYGYDFVWDIRAALDVIKRYGIPYQKMAVKHLYPTVNMDDDEVKETLEHRIHNPDPVIVALFDVSNFLPVIDGRHRVVKKYFSWPRGRRSIKAYVLSPKFHLMAAADPAFQSMYKIHHNLVVMMNYMAGKMSDVSFVQDDAGNNELYVV